MEQLQYGNAFTELCGVKTEHRIIPSCSRGFSMSQSSVFAFSVQYGKYSVGIGDSAVNCKMIKQ